MVYFDNTISPYESHEEVWVRRYLQEARILGWGAYEIKGDTIKASIYYNFSNPVTNNRIANFQGIIRNKDTILQWRLIAPYPKLRKNPRREFDFLFKMNRDLYFKSLPTKPFMDSVSEKAWILKYRDNK